MNNLDLILIKQKNWAKRNQKPLIAHNNKSDNLTYFANLSDNLFIPLSDKATTQFNKADGGELNDSSNGLAKMKAIHSSSALAVNVFQYWQTQNKILEIAHCCGFCDKDNKYVRDLVFEKNDLIIDSSFEKNPNIDVVISNSDLSKLKIFAIECKFTEPYNSSGHADLKQRYINLNELWKDIPIINDFVNKIDSPIHSFKHLHASQLIKHILCLKQTYGKKGFKLLYLFYDSVGEHAIIHQNELRIFSEMLKSENINFSSLSYQELILKISNNYYSGNEEYIDYLIDRYL